MKMGMARVYLFPANCLMKIVIMGKGIFPQVNGSASDTSNFLPSHTFLPTSQYHYMENGL
jgi:hypothetical protein